MGSEDWFCGDGVHPFDILRLQTNVTDTDSKIQQTQCFVNVVTVLVHSLYIAIPTIVLIYTRCFVKLQQPRLRSRRWPGHTFRWVISIVMLIITLASIAEGILSDNLNQCSRQAQLYLPACLFFVAFIASLKYFDMCESQRHSVGPLCLLIYWLACLTLNSASIAFLYQREVHIDAFRIWIIMSTMLLLICLVVIDLSVVFFQYISRRHDCATRSGEGYNLLGDDNQDIQENKGDDVSFLSTLTFSWLKWLLKIGYKRHLTIGDLRTLNSTSRSQYIYDTFKKHFYVDATKHVTIGRLPSLWKVFFRVYKVDIFYAGLTILGHDLVSLIGPLALNGIVTYAITYNDDSETSTQYVTIAEFFSNGFVLVGVIFLASVIQCVLMQQHLYQCNVIGVHVKTALQTMVFDKSLHLSSYSIASGSMTAGQITNHMTVDAMNVLYFCQRLHYVWAVPLKIILVMILLYLQVGMAAFVALVILIISIAILFLIGRVQTRVQKDVMIHSDERLKQSNETVLAIKLLKLYGWEHFFTKTIEGVRNLEMAAILKYNACFGWCTFVIHSVPRIMQFAVFASYPLILREPLMPDTTFTVLCLLNLLIEPMYFIPSVTSLSVSAFIAIKRLQAFFVAPSMDDPLSSGKSRKAFERDETNANLLDSGVIVETVLTEKTSLLLASQISDNTEEKFYGSCTGTDSYDEMTNSIPRISGNLAIQIDNASFTWGDVCCKPALQDICLKIPRGEVTVIVGHVGSGKSSLLSAILGEMTLQSGSILFGRHNGRISSGIAYAGQKAWLMNASLQDNILFGQPYNRKRYQKIIEASALKPDIEILPGGDKTEIGEKGINLSGGQKQRVSVARAIYSKNPIVLFDDPLSALDAVVGSHVFFEGIIGRLRKANRTVVIVTHQLQFLPHADKIVVLTNGQISAQGAMSDIARQDPELYQKCQREMIEAREAILSMDSATDSEAIRECREAFETTVLQHGGRIPNKINNKEVKVDGLIQDEDMARGQVSSSVYLYYIRSMGWLWAFSFLFSTVALDSFNVAGDFWLSDWSEAAIISNETQGLQSPSVLVDDIYNEYIGVYAVLCAMVVLMAGLVSVAAVFSTGFAAKNIHVKMLRNIIQSPMRFFDTTPVGRILNRFSNDTHTIDMKMLVMLMMLLHFSSALLFAFIVNAIISPVFILEVLPIAVIYWILVVYFIASSRELQRLDSVTRSPVLAHFTETLGGLTTIRAYRDQRRFFSNMHDKIDTNNAAFLYLKASYGWVGLRMSVGSAILVLMVALTTLLQSIIYGNIEASEVGLAITYALMVSTNMYDFVQGAAGTEMQMNAVERVQHYSSLPTENDQGMTPAKEWPHTGEIHINNISVRYASTLPPVLKDVSLHVRPGEKIGICGRTGSGKSSLTLALFRLIEMFKGQIIIDGMDIAHLSINDLRRRLSIIPQDPVLFTGSIRSNLDPCSTNSDSELWTALEIAQLKNTLKTSGLGLDSVVSEGGENFSMGQRQLFCLARAFLRNSRILIMDEATASIDYDTEQILQSVVASAFHDKTVITIAHRVSTILECDTVWVLDDGEVIECDSPGNLLDQHDSVFYSIAQANK